jgi:hypothetical protein
MVKRLWAAMAVVALGLALPFVYSGEKLVSGPQVGAEVPGPFHPLNVTGEAAGKKNCLYCAYGEAPVAVVFARDLTPQVAALIKQIDATTAKNKAATDMGSFAVFCSDDEKLQSKLEAFAAKEKISNLVLSIDNPTGPAAYKIAKEADVTVVYYNKHTVASNHVFRAGELKDADVSRVASDVKTILPK